MSLVIWNLKKDKIYIWPYVQKTDARLKNVA